MGCEISINNSSSIISDCKAINFCSEYMSYYLAIEGYYIPKEIETQESLEVKLSNNKRYIYLYVNNEKHLMLNIKEFHSIQVFCETTSNSHHAFFQQLYYHRVSGVDIIENYPF